MKIEVLYALTAKQYQVVLELPEGATIAQAIECLAQMPECSDWEIDGSAVGVFGQVRPLESSLAAGDRLETVSALARRSENRQTTQGRKSARKCLGHLVRGGVSRRLLGILLGLFLSLLLSLLLRRGGYEVSGDGDQGVIFEYQHHFERLNEDVGHLHRVQVNPLIIVKRVLKYRSSHDVFHLIPGHARL